MWIKTQFGRVVDVQKSHYITVEPMNGEFIVYAYFPCFYALAGDYDDGQERIGLGLFCTGDEAKKYLDELLVRLQSHEKNHIK